MTWINKFSRGLLLPEVHAAVHAPWAEAAATSPRPCGNGAPGFACTRVQDQPGRHVATGFTRGLVCAAWPGDHVPTLADLEATP